MKRILTGDRPTGKMHIGHYFGTLKNRIALQNEYEQFVMIANIQALTDNFDNPSKIRNSIQDLILDYYAVGIDFEKTTIFIQSEIPEIHEIFIYLANFATIQQVSQNPTIKQELNDKSADHNFSKSTPLGFFIYPIHQAADILCVNADLVPVGKDQAPMVEGCRDLARKFNDTYNTEILKLPEALFGVSHNVPGFDGHIKMGKSLSNAIYLSDTDERISECIKKTKTDPARIHADTPGDPSQSVVFTYLDLLNSTQSDGGMDQELSNMKEDYKKGIISDKTTKEYLNMKMKEFISPIREKRIEGEKIQSELFDKVLSNTKTVRSIARQVADNMKECMQINF